MDWTVDYGDGPRACTVPHAWRQDVDVRWEGPAVYRTQVSVTQPDSWLVFQGVSYQARVYLDDELALEHCGIWDAFAVSLPVGTVEVRVEVVKNGGATFPVKDVLSGFLPYVFNTFGGIYREVEVVVSKADPTTPPPTPFPDPTGKNHPVKSKEGAPEPRISVEGTKLFIDGKPWYMRGVLSWGWYPEVGHPNPPIEVIRDEVRKVKALGFNLVKFCLWVPPHSYFQVLEEEDMWAWMELPLWMPSPAMDLEAAFLECEKIVRQYRHHDRIVCWTCGCELSESTPHEYRKRLFEMVSDLTGCPLVKDNSGGSEMYGGDLREYGTFYDFHPYCDTQFYPVVLDSLMIGPRKKMPVLLGEFNDYDVYRRPIDIRGGEFIEAEPEFPWIIKGYVPKSPYWASMDRRLNDQGVRWQHDLPEVVYDKAGDLIPGFERRMPDASRVRRSIIDHFVYPAVLSNDDIAGYVVTGIVHTPISTSGQIYEGRYIDPVFDIRKPDNVFTIPHRRPPWIIGGNRPGWSDPRLSFVGPVTIRLGARFELGFQGTFQLTWMSGSESVEKIVEVILEPNMPAEICELQYDFTSPFATLLVSHGDNQWFFTFGTIERMSWKDAFDWSVEDKEKRLGGDRVGSRAGCVRFGAPEGEQAQVCLMTDLGTVPAPFFRECVSFTTPRNDFLRSDGYLFSVATDRVIDPEWLESELPDAEWLLTRVDTRTYKRQPYVARKGKTVVTTLRPWGGLGAQPYGLDNNPAGCELLRVLMRLAESG